MTRFRHFLCGLIKCVAVFGIVITMGFIVYDIYARYKMSHILGVHPVQADVKEVRNVVERWSTRRSYPYPNLPDYIEKGSSISCEVAYHFIHKEIDYTQTFTRKYCWRFPVGSIQTVYPNEDGAIFYPPQVMRETILEVIALFIFSGVFLSLRKKRSI